MKTPPTVIVLAAGRGSRFKAPEHKLLQPLGNSTVLGTTLGHAIESGLPVRVVTTEALAAEAGRHVAQRDISRLPDATGSAGERLGMGYSIAAGVNASADAAGWLVLPADMPTVTPATLRAVAAALPQHAVVYAQHTGRRGHPVGFAAELYSELVQLSGDEGARRVVARYPSFGVEVDDPGVLVDIDTLDDLAAVRAPATRGDASAGRRARS
ncbi:MAG: nucleotidyltransferase family protein [Ideonella sp.]|nr:nucleotidyltransferase family protein [Ideonella sp.]MCC7457439.1 nucleotidyltransferase family protein [Nitrospira sp.]